MLLVADPLHVAVLSEVGVGAVRRRYELTPLGIAEPR